MKCMICGHCGYDGAMDDSGEYVCVDCWAEGEASARGRTAKCFVGADVPYHVDYPVETQKRFLDACNGKYRK